jgi:hypothetical protein
VSRADGRCPSQCLQSLALTDAVFLNERSLVQLQPTRGIGPRVQIAARRRQRTARGICPVFRPALIRSWLKQEPRWLICRQCIRPRRTCSRARYCSCRLSRRHKRLWCSSCTIGEGSSFRPADNLLFTCSERRPVHAMPKSRGRKPRCSPRRRRRARRQNLFTHTGRQVVGHRAKHVALSSEGNQLR